MWLQAFLAHKHPIKKKNSKRREKAARTLRLMEDSCARSLIFSYNIRDEFYLEVSQKFYSDSGYPTRRFSCNDFEWRSEYMDSWIHVEFFYKNHLPVTYVKLSQARAVKQHPNDITFEGFSCSSLFSLTL